MKGRMMIGAVVAALCCAPIAQAAEVPGISGLHIGMAAKDALGSFDFVEEKAPDPNDHQILSSIYMPGYWHGTKPYVLGPFKFRVSIHVDEASKNVDFISLVEDFKEASKVPDLDQVPAALTEKYGAPLRVLDRPEPGHEFTFTNHWWATGVEIECVIWPGSKTPGIVEPSVAVYYQATDFTKGAQKPKSVLGQGL